MAPDLSKIEVDKFLAQAETLATLMAHPAYAAWISLLGDMRQSYLEELARCSDPGEFRYWQGAASALAEILDRPGRIVASAGSFVETEESGKGVGVIRPDLRAVLGMGHVSTEDDI